MSGGPQNWEAFRDSPIRIIGCTAPLHSGRQRIIGYLLRENTETDARALTVTLPTSKGTIASRLNLTQEHFSRILHELSEAGLIVVEGRKITIPDVEKLRGYDL